MFDWLTQEEINAQLSVEEAKIYQSWLEAYNDNRVTPEIIKEYVTTLKNTVAKELYTSSRKTEQELKLKLEARLYCYTLLEEMLDSRDKIKQSIAKEVEKLKGKLNSISTLA